MKIIKHNKKKIFYSFLILLLLVAGGALTGVGILINQNKTERVNKNKELKVLQVIKEKLETKLDVANQKKKKLEREKRKLEEELVNVQQAKITEVNKNAELYLKISIKIVELTLEKRTLNEKIRKKLQTKLAELNKLSKKKTKIKGQKLYTKVHTIVKKYRTN